MAPNQANNPTDKTLAERYDALPDEVSSLIEFKVYEVVVSDAKTQFGLTEKQAALLENEVMLVLLFLLPYSGLANRIATELEIDPGMATAVVEFLDEELFMLIGGILEQTDRFFDEPETTDTSTNDSAILSTAPNIKPAITNTGLAQNSAPTAAAGDKTAAQPTPKVQPLRTMGEDIKRVHGYGAYRQLYKDQAAEEEPVYRSSQDAIVSKRTDAAPSAATPGTDQTSTPSSDSSTPPTQKAD